MIGFYNYTVLLTYLSLVSAGLGIFVSLSGTGHPYLGALCLLACGLCDAFDGKVARTKTDRSEMECQFGIQIDSLSDVVAFGVLPACIGGALWRTSPFLRTLAESWPPALGIVLRFALYTVLLLYILAAMIRLAYFNVTEEERQKTENGARKTYLGVPVTTAALIFPAVLLLQYLTTADITLAYFLMLIVTGLAFLVRIQVRKPGLRGILIMVAIGAVEFILMALFRHLRLR